MKRNIGTLETRVITRQPEGLNLESGECKPDIILQAVQFFTGQSILNGNTRRRNREIADTRHFAHYFMTINRDITLTEMGKFTNKNHSTVMASRNRVEGFLSIYPEMEEKVREIGEYIKWLNQLDMEIVHSEISKERVRYFYFLLDQLGIRSMKNDLVKDASEGRTESVRELKKLEMDMLVKHLEQKLKEAKEYASPKKQSVLKMDRMRKRILSICYSIGWTRFDPESGKHVVDMDRLNAWMRKYSYLHQELNEYTYLELPALITQFERLLNSTLTSMKSE